MNKQTRIITLAVAFILSALFLILGWVILLSNTFGINMDMSGLLPKLEITVLDESKSSLASNKPDSNILYGNEDVTTIVNNTDQQIIIYKFYNYVANQNIKTPQLSDIYGGPELNLKAEGKQLIATSIDYDYDALLKNLAFYDLSNVLAISIYYEAPTENYQGKDKEIILEAGESYEI